ncbi:glycosyltransferase [Thalassotalea piscium]|uniref:Rhamnosyl/mannosyltransferase n=1 Tax=Thalassotalea piscium TaxID=1230533 RepID=A0A7X0TT29_9GAMM|nr:glycosyltransferase [Thalassotalea piscium]MBB6542776.1 rhamnosyl/mannosyltransferase [Thalassotalea piscium]
MKILHIGKYFPPFHGGVENFMFALMEQQSLDGHQVSAIVHHHEKKQPFIVEVINGAKVHRVPFFGQAVYAPISPTFGYYLQRIAKEEKPDIIHIHTPNLSAFWCLFFPCVRNIPWVIQWQSDVIGAVPDTKITMLYPFYRLFERALLNKASKIIVATPPYAQTSKPLRLFQNKIEVVPLGLFGNNCDVINASVSQNTLNLLMVGRLTYYKGHTLLLDALSELSKQGLVINLTIVGNGELKERIINQIEKCNLAKQVTLLSNLSDEALAVELNNTDLLCLPSIERTEAFGVVLLEAMRASKPCLVSDVEGSGMSWVVQDNKTGFVVKHNNVKSLVDKLRYVIEHPELLTNYGKAGRERFDKHFAISSVSNKITKIYQKLLS